MVQRAVAPWLIQQNGFPQFGAVREIAAEDRIEVGDS
jgi:hypothetical protein